MTVIGWSIIVSAFILGAFYYEVGEKKANSAVIVACIEHGGNLYVSWNWKQVCELKGTSK